MTKSYRVADYIADFIAEMGVHHVFLLPGGGAMYLVDAVGKCPRLEVVPCLHEQAAAISAEAYARINENIGVAMVTTGPGATNAITAVAGAWIESVPMMVISGQVKRSDMLRDSPLRQKGVQEVEIIRMVQSITKFAVTVENPSEIRAIMERAYWSAREGRAGPVWIDVPLDVQGAPIDPATLIPWEDVQVQPVNKRPAEVKVEEVLSLITKAKRPLILAGHGVRLAGAAKIFRTWIESLGIPVVSTWNALDILPYDHPLYVGRPGVVALRAPNFAVQNCDLLISIGSRLDNIITAYNPTGFARTAKKIVIDVDENEIRKLDMDIAVSIACDAGTFLNTMKQRKMPMHTDWTSWQSRCADWKQRYSVNDGQPIKTSKREISHYQFVEALSDALPTETLISTGSSGLAVEVFYTVFRNKQGQRVFLTSGLGAMGYGLPAAIGACFANNRQPMIAVESDGSLQLNIQELATLHAFNLPICLIVMNNGGYASIRNTQRNYFKGHYVGTGPEAGLFLPELEMLARTYDLDYLKIDSPKNLQTGLHKAIYETNDPIIVEVCLVHNENLTPKVAAIPQDNGAIISMPLEDMSPLLPLNVLKNEMVVEVQESSLMARKKLSE